MRRLAPALWLLAAAACSVPLEGAPCATDANCPDEQRCDAATQACVECVPDPACTAGGTFCVAADDTALRTCSTTAGGCRYSSAAACPYPQTCQGVPGQAACGCPSLGSSAGESCSPADDQACDPASRNAIVCVPRGACRVWEPAAGTTCTSQGLVCDAPTGTPTCVCDAYSGTDLFADSVSGSATSAPVKPTGAPSPSACRFRSLTGALGAASAGDTVKMTGWAASEVKFSATASGESFPLVVKPGVVLTTDEPFPVPAHYVVEVDQAGAARPALQLDHDTAASGFTVRPGIGGSASVAVWVNCADAGTSQVYLSSLVIDGTGSLPAAAIDEGLRLSGPCGVSADSLAVRDAAKAGVRVLSSTSAATLSIANSSMRENGDSGLVVNVDASMGAPSLSVTGNDIAGNGATTAYTLGTVTRKGGGVVLLSAAPSPFVFTGNVIHGNSFDQVLVYSSNGWSLATGACGAASNTFTCYDGASPGGPWVGLAAIGGGAVNAANDWWANAVPSSGMDYFQAAGSTVAFTPSCGASVPTCP